ncbi:FMN-linked oxidoreductase [Auriscalpium vulgare]|uniref:FMN-linked oxidoreductase n=1 Tax=Auriscalpium vulgare TaxID=40419 RepID=A0ACB8R7R9_9AGAM|nr:FMN-linked oxidoreductase [Auriscalpium vulgare]
MNLSRTSFKLHTSPHTTRVSTHLRASMSTPKLFQPYKLGSIGELKHRIVMAPVTRNRGNNKHVLVERSVEHYRARSVVPGTLIIGEATYIAQKASGYTFHVPGIWNDEQIAGWKKVVDAVHANGSYIVLQLWALGRAAIPEVLEQEDPSLPYVSAGDIQVEGVSKAPRPLTHADIKEYVQLYAQAARNGMEKAGFDGVEIHGGNGYIIDQFLKDRTNNRTDEYGGSDENKARFALEVVEAVANAVGQDKVGLRLAPWQTRFDYRLYRDDPKPTFGYLVRQVRERLPDLAYLHVIEPRIQDSFEIELNETNDFLRELWKGKTYMTAGGFTREMALEHAEHTDELIGFGRAFISNPDLVERLQKNIPLTPHDRTHFYTLETEVGYNDYPRHDEDKPIPPPNENAIASLEYVSAVRKAVNEGQ